MVKRKANLIPKDQQKGTFPSNYHPITCYDPTWKLLSGIIAGKISRDMMQYISGAQKGISRDTSGAKCHLMVDSAVTCVCRKQTMTQCHIPGPWSTRKKLQEAVHYKQDIVPTAVLHRAELTRNWGNHPSYTKLTSYTSTLTDKQQ